MQIEFVRTWRTNPLGSVRPFPDGAANVLIRRGIAREVGHHPAPATVSESQTSVGHKRNRKRT